MYQGRGRGGGRGGGSGRGGHYGGGRYGGGSGFDQSRSQHGRSQVRGENNGYRAQVERTAATGMEMVSARGHVPGLPWMNPPPVRASEDLTMIHNASTAEMLDARDAWMDEHDDQAPTVAFMTPNLGDIMAMGLRNAKLDGGPDVPGEPIKFKIPIPDNVEEACAAVRQHEIEEAARLNQRAQIQEEQTVANQVWGRIRHQQDREGYAGGGGMGVMRGPGNGRIRGGFRGRGAGRAQTQPFRAHQQAQRNQQLGQTRGGGGEFRGRGRGGNRARPGWAGEQQRRQQQRGAQTSKGQGLKTQAQADPDPAIGTECKVCRGLDHLEMDCAKGSNLGSDSTWCMYHHGRVNGNGTQECSGALNRCIGIMLNHERMEPSVVLRMVFDWIVSSRSSRPEPRCVGADWHWATCIAEHMEQNPEVVVTAEMLPVRRHEVKAREKNKRGDPTRTWTMFDFQDLVWSKSEFKDPYWDTQGDRTELVKRLKEYAAAGWDMQPLLTKKEEDETDRVVKLEFEPEVQAEKTKGLIKEEPLD